MKWVLRHSLPIVKVLTDDAHMNEACGKYAGMDRYEARKAIVADLEAQGCLAKFVEPHKHNVGTCYRCGTTVEPHGVQTVVCENGAPGRARPSRRCETADIRFVPERFEKIYFYWMENTRDWCISRQLWWGHRIPAYYCDECGKVTVSAEHISTCPACGGAVHQDEDTLDTWFSSALWPFSTLGWPDETEDLAYFYPTSTLVTGYDIITFWVSPHDLLGPRPTPARPRSTRCSSTALCAMRRGVKCPKASATASTRWRSFAITAPMRCA